MCSSDLDRLEGLTEPVRDQFIDIVGVVYQRTQQALLRASLVVPGGPSAKSLSGVIPVSGQFPAPAPPGTPASGFAAPPPKR